MGRIYKAFIKGSIGISGIIFGLYRAFIRVLQG